MEILDKWRKPIKWLTKKMEKIAIKNSDYLISDNIGIQKYYEDIHNAKSFFSLTVQMCLNYQMSSYVLGLYNINEYDYSILSFLD